ncbi:MAG TPA: hypothetical protein VKJ07_10660, partial [Mycobacteriales bacterium]|nr:hypothetical protein [Mycobacteriales bacterium]
GTGTGSGTGDGTGTGTGNGVTPAKPDPNLAARAIDYGQALRTAALKLVGTLPTLDEQAAVTDAASYSAQIDKYLADPRFALQIKSYYSDMMKMGGTLKATVGQTTVNVSLDTAPTYAAELVVKDQPITNLFTATTNTCPTLSADGATFTDAVCPVANGLKTAGVLTDPGAMAQFYSNMSFRRVRWIQEAFACTKFPAEYSAKPDPNLAARQIDYGQALRTAAVKLVGALPTLDEQAAVTDAASYSAQIDKYLADPRFALQIKSYFSDMMKMGGTLKTTVGQTAVNVSLDTAPTYAAELVVKDQPITNLFTASTNTCPTLSADGTTFTDAACPVANGLKTAGVLT